jgi:predicted RNA methylase
MTNTLKASPEIIDILRSCVIDDEGITLVGKLDRKQYEAVNKFLELAGAKWNRGKKKHIFSSQNTLSKIKGLLNTGEILNEKKHFQSFYTPMALALDVIELAEIEIGMDILEPSAGEGALATAAHMHGANVTCVEINPEAVKVLREKGFVDIVEADFLKWSTDKLYDRIVMNPPFTKGQDILHVLHAWEFLRPGGILVAIISAGSGIGKAKDKKAFEELMENARSISAVPAGTFKESGTNVATTIIELRKKNDQD